VSGFVSGGPAINTIRAFFCHIVSPCRGAYSSAHRKFQPEENSHWPQAGLRIRGLSLNWPSTDKQADQKKNEEDDEYNFCDSSGSSGDTPETDYGG